MDALSPPPNAKSSDMAVMMRAMRMTHRYGSRPNPFRSPAFVVLLVIVLIVFGTVGFRLIEGWPWFKSLYGTLMTVSTIGGEPENELSSSGQRFNVVLIFLGLVVVGFAVAALTRAVIESELGSLFGRRRMERDIAQLKDHIIICGAGRVGRRVAQEVHSHGVPFVIIEQDPGKAHWALDHDFLVLVGDATDEAVLRQARIEHARGLASAVTSDAQNVYIVLTARGMAPQLPIIARASEEAAESKLMKAGATSVLSPYTFTGQRMAQMLTRPNVQHFLDVALSPLSVGDLDIQIDEVRVGENSRLAGGMMMDAATCRGLGVIILALRTRDGALHFNPGPEQSVAPGDSLIAIGDSRKLKQLELLAGA